MNYASVQTVENSGPFGWHYALGAISTVVGLYLVIIAAMLVWRIVAGLIEKHSTPPVVARPEPYPNDIAPSQRQATR